MSELNAVLCKIHNSKKKASHMTGAGFLDTFENLFYMHKRLYNPLGATQNISEVKTGVDGKHYFGNGITGEGHADRFKKIAIPILSVVGALGATALGLKAYQNKLNTDFRKGRVYYY
jgi:hypothetical protein